MNKNACCQKHLSFWINIFFLNVYDFLDIERYRKFAEFFLWIFYSHDFLLFPLFLLFIQSYFTCLRMQILHCKCIKRLHFRELTGFALLQNTAQGSRDLNRVSAIGDEIVPQIENGASFLKKLFIFLTDAQAI